MERKVIESADLSASTPKQQGHLLCNLLGDGRPSLDLIVALANTEVNTEL